MRKNHIFHPIHGFTLIELLIVIVVIAILSLIVIPALLSASRRAREATLVSNLNSLRYAIERFRADTGVNPDVLTDIVATKPEDLQTDIPPSTFRGAYISTEGGLSDGLPRNPFIASTENDYTKHWKYDPTNGNVSVPDSMTDLLMTDGRRFGEL